jgi:hypothetical protein
VRSATPRPPIRFATAADGVRLAWAMSGSGQPLVKIGTWMSHLEFDLESPAWGHLPDWPAARFTLLRYDQRATAVHRLERDRAALPDAAGRADRRGAGAAGRVGRQRGRARAALTRTQAR